MGDGSRRVRHQGLRAALHLPRRLLACLLSASAITVIQLP